MMTKGRDNLLCIEKSAATSDDVRHQDASPTSTPFEVAAPRGTNQVSGRKSALRRPEAAPMPSATPPVYDFSIQADTSWRDDTDRNRACADKNWSDHSYQANGGTVRWSSLVLLVLFLKTLDTSFGLQKKRTTVHWKTLCG